MADRYCSVSGWSVEAVRLTATPDRHDGEWLRVRYRGYYVADCASVSEVEQWVPLAQLDLDALVLAA